MSMPILATKLYIPTPRAERVFRPRLIEQLNEGLRQGQGFGRKLTLISAPAGCGKTTLLSSWINQETAGGKLGEASEATLYAPSSILRPSRVAWLSLDARDKDLTRFLVYLVAALQTLVTDVDGTSAKIGEGVLGALQSPHPPPTETLLTTLLNEIAAFPEPFVLVLDDYHVIEAPAVDQALIFLLEHLPPQMHLVIASREDPNLPLARMRARGQLTELRAGDLRFTPDEAADFLNRVMGLNLSAEDVAALETRTEGWIAGLHLAALSIQRQSDAAGFIHSFTGSHHYVLDYLLEEVLRQQSASVQRFLLCTSILDRLCGPLCDAVCASGTGLDGDAGQSVVSGQETLEYLERANLFIVPLDNERRWYRYHHLFGDLLRQRLQCSDPSRSPPFIPPQWGGHSGGIATLHIRASQWYEDHGLWVEAFHHAAAARDIARAVRLMEEKGLPLHHRAVVAPILDWLASLPKAVLDATPLLWVRQATFALVIGQTTGVEEKLQAAEAALRRIAPALSVVE
ncbi:MAG: AAA family ATPase, partial [Anaerolineae bacterium]|nr:AAA family ATPase [Anaerolineae bacterium]